MANSDALLKRMKFMELDLMLNALHFPSEGFEDTKMRIEVLEAQMAAADAIEETDDKKDEEKEEKEAEEEEEMPELSEQQ